MQMQIAVCDDEDIICQEIKKKLLNIRQEYEITTYNSGHELIDSKKDFDLILLDIKMPEIDGMKTAEILRGNGNDSLIIFLTSYVEAMPDAFKVKAFRFLCKPLEKERFMEAVLGAEKELVDNKKIFVTIKGETKIINVTDILYLEAFGDGTYIFTKNEVLESNETLKKWGEKLGTEHFFQTHKSYIIALRYVKRIESKYVIIKNVSCDIPVSRRRNAELKERLKKYIREQSHYF